MEHLATLTHCHWRFRLGRNESGEMVALVGYRNTEQYTDALYLYDRNDALAVRLLADQPGARGGIVWRYYGSLADSVLELLALPDPGMRLAPTLIIATSSDVDWGRGRG